MGGHVKKREPEKDEKKFSPLFAWHSIAKKKDGR